MKSQSEVKFLCRKEQEISLTDFTTDSFLNTEIMLILKIRLRELFISRPEIIVTAKELFTLLYRTIKQLFNSIYSVFLFLQ